MENIVLWNDYAKDLYYLDTRETKLYQDYLNYDKNVGMFENMFNINDAIRDNLITITQDNIHLYYEFMSDDELLKISSTFLSDILLKRQQLVVTDKDIYPNLIKGWWENIEIVDIPYKNSNGTISYDDIRRSFFGIKDTLKPIEEYICEIKNSDRYKKYISKSCIL
jgi:hypothetical protein